MPSKKHHNNTSRGDPFINLSHPDDVKKESTRKAVRSGAMVAVCMARSKPGKHAVTVELAVPAALAPRAMFPFELDSRARQLIHFMHGKASTIYLPFRREWFAMAVVDTSALYLSLANAALFMNKLVDRAALEYSDSAESGRYFGICLAQVTKRISSEAGKFSRGLITTILGFICHDSTVGKWDRWAIHMAGLEKMVCLRGGFEGLGDQIPLFCLWFDLTGAAVFDRAPRFPVPADLENGPGQHEQASSQLLDLILKLDELHPGLQPLGPAFAKVASVARFVDRNAAQPRFREPGMKATNLLAPAAHVVLSLPRLGEWDASRDHQNPGEDGNSGEKHYALDIRTRYGLLMEMARLALLILVARLKRVFSLLADELVPLRDRFLQLLPVLTASHISVLPTLRIWACLTVACSLPSAHLRDTLQAELCRAMRESSVVSVTQAVEVAKSLVWVETLEEPGVLESIEWI